jgi:hypothetical protein
MKEPENNQVIKNRINELKNELLLNNNKIIKLNLKEK